MLQSKPLYLFYYEAIISLTLCVLLLEQLLLFVLHCLWLRAAQGVHLTWVLLLKLFEAKGHV